MKVLNEVSSIKIYTKVYKCELLIIDDLGCEKVSPFVVAEFLNLINNRSVTNFKTLINTNLNESRLLEKYGQRITSRLLGTSKIINFPGKDLRMLTKMAVS